MNSLTLTPSAIHIPEVVFGQFHQAERSHLNEMELAERWEMSHRTLQRWRMDGRGPTYLKLGKRVSYPMSSILEFEKHITHISTSQRANS